MVQLAEVAQDATQPLRIEEISEEVDLSQTKVAISLNRIEEVGAVGILPSGQVVATTNEDTADRLRRPPKPGKSFASSPGRESR